TQGGVPTRVAKTGGPLQLLSSTSTPISAPGDIALDASNVYYTDQVANTVGKIAKSGGNPVVLATGQLQPMSIAVDATDVYWTNLAGGTVNKVPIAGGPVVPLASNQAGPSGIALGSNVYWRNQNDGTIAMVAKSGGAATPLVTGSSLLIALTVDATSIYFVGA